MRTLLFAFLAVCQVTFAQPGDNAVNISDPFYVPVERTIRIPLTGASVPVTVQQYGPDTSFVYINMHDNEQSSVSAARAILGQRGGTLIKVENKGQRVIYFHINGARYGFDPNRIFSQIGIEQTLRENGRYSKAAAGVVSSFAAQLLSLIPSSPSCIVALHNNFDGAFSIRSYQPGGERQRDAKSVYANPEEDIDDIVLTTDSLLYERMAEAGYNSILQDNQQAKKDGSLSIYCGELGIRYVNIETEHGRVEQYERMLGHLINVLEIGDSY